MAERGRKRVFQSKDEWAHVVSLRVPRDVYDQVQRYLKMHPRMTLTEFILDGIRLRLETPADPRDIILSDDNTVIRELQDMIRAQVQAEIGKLNNFMGSAFDALKLSPTPEATAPQPTTQPAIPLALEPAPTTAHPVAVPQAQETPSAKTPAPHGLPRETLQAIADERTLCEGLSYSEFAQRLHDKGIYSATAKDGSKVPANRGNIKKWLDQAREAGML